MQRNVATLDLGVLPVQASAAVELVVTLQYGWTNGLAGRMYIATSGDAVVRLPIPGDLAPLALDARGRRLLLAQRPRPAASTWTLVEHEISTGAQRRIPLPEDVLLVAAAWLDEKRVVVMSDGEDPEDPDASVAVIEMLNLVSGEHRRVWATQGGSSGESGVACSPDGRLVAVTYLHPDDTSTTAVIDLAGNTVTSLEITEITPAGNQNWLDSTTLLCAPRWGRPLCTIDIHTHAERHLPYLDTPLARVGDLLIFRQFLDHSLQRQISAATIGGSELEPWLIFGDTPIERVLAAVADV